MEMDTNTLHDMTVSVLDSDPGGGIEAKSIENCMSEDTTSDTEVIREVGSALIRLELDLACCSEKLVNLNLLMMHVAARESDFEAFTSEEEDTLVDSAEKALEFDVFSGIFYSEVREMNNFIGKLEKQINNASQVLSSYKHLGEALLDLEVKLHDAEESMKQSQEQVSELMMQSAKFQRILSSINKEESSDEDRDAVNSEDSNFLNTTSKIKMQTPEQQRHILRMLEKSLARELELENRLTECMQALDEMKFKLRSSQQEVLSAEEETATIYVQFLEADNASAVLMGISKELIGKMQSYQLNINSALHRENELKIRLENCMEAVQKLEKEKAVLQELAEKSGSEALVLREKVNSLEEELKASESMLLNVNTSLEEKVSIAESRAEKAEAECKLLAEANKELNAQLDLLNGSSVSREQVDSLEKQLMEKDVQLQLATTSVEASQEKQSLLDSTIIDMEIVIEKLKSKVSKADARADSAEDKCIILSESNEELNEELSLLRGKLECLEASLQRAEENKLAITKDINIRTKMITDLVMQLAIERERLHKQMSLLMVENKALAEKLHMANKASSKSMNHEGGEPENKVLSSEHQAHFVESGKGSKEIPIPTEVEKKYPEDALDGGCKLDPLDVKSKLETVRTIDAGRLRVKCVLSASLIVVIAVLAACFLWPENCPF